MGIASMSVSNGVQHVSAVGNVRPDLMMEDNTARHNYAGKSVSVFELNFSYSTLYEAGPPVLKNCTLQLEPGSRCLLLGSNGAGKTTMLNLLGGKHIHQM